MYTSYISLCAATIFSVFTVPVLSNTVDLLFNSYNCDELPRTVSLDKTYTLSWFGKTSPHLCTFNFTGGGNGESYINMQLCFESEEYDLPSYDVELIVSEESQKWVYDGSQQKIERKCIERAYELIFKMQLTSYYKESSWKLKLKITSENLPNADAGWNVLDYIRNTALEILPFLIAAVVLFCCFKNEKLRNRFCTPIRKFLKIGNSSSSQQSTDTLTEGSRRLSITENRLNYESTDITHMQDNDSTSSSEFSLTFPSEQGEFAHGQCVPSAPYELLPPGPPSNGPLAPPPSYDDVVRKSQMKSGLE
ncbi:unnamed protein product [Mytilus coruscus]|uniref:Uncharacterized protein n=1 Tax=Mytilus coruscus TaxID=42192 RepID=A0A6J8DKK2_MYTCO|nr:unnamed protein product [Mytilus coruscus]